MVAATGPLNRPASRRKPARRASRWQPVRRHVRRGLGVALVLGGLGWGAVTVWPAVWQEALDWTAHNGLGVTDILVEGRRFTDPAELVRAIPVRMGDSLLSLSPAGTRQELMRIAWVDEAIVERRWPGTVYVRLIERIPVAVLRENDRLWLVDKSGLVIGEKPEGLFGHLLVLGGDGASAHAFDLLTLLVRYETLRPRVVSANRVSGRRWNLYLDNGIEIMLPEEQPQRALDWVVQKDAEDQLLSRAVQRIDLRLADRIAIKSQPPGTTLHQTINPAGQHGQDE